MPSCYWTVLVMLASSLPASLTALQQPITARFATRLGSYDGEGIIPGTVRSVARDRRGNFWVTVHQSRQPPVVFGSEGRFLFRAGGAGEGPGEMSGSVIVRATQGDSVFVFDEGNGRLNVFDLQGRYRWSQPVPLPDVYDFAVLSGRRVVVSASIRLSDHIGLPLHLYEDGVIRRSFGSDVAIYHPQRQRDLDRAIAVGSGRSFWTLHRTGLVLQQWDEQGNLIRTIRGDPEWFGSASPHRDIPAERTPTPQFVDVRIENGMIWTSATVPEEDWYAGYRYGQSADGRANWIVDDARDVLDTVIQIFDLDGHEVASARLDQVLPLLLGSGYVASLETYTQAAPVVEIWHLGLTSSSSEGRHQ